jgi:hypothetical protein
MVMPRLERKTRHMRKLIIAVALVPALIGIVQAADAELDMDLMQTIEDTNKSLSSNIAIQNSTASTADAKELQELFAKVESHFIAKGDAADAVDLSRRSKDLASSIIKSVAVKDFGTATDSATDLSRTCRTCHTFYKKS